MELIIEGLRRPTPVWPKGQGPNKLDIVWSPTALASGKINPHWTLDETELAKRVRAYLLGPSRPINTAAPES
jgi:hypothetical protein